MPLYRCYGCRTEFEAAKPVCEACGMDASANPRDKDMVVRLTVIHFDPPGRRPGVGLNHAACDASIKLGAPKCQFTSEPVAVTCPKCKESDVYKAADGESGGPSEAFLAKPVRAAKAAKTNDCGGC